MSKTKKDYVEECKEIFDEVNKNRKVLVRYNRDKKNHKNGVIVAFKDDNNKVMVGVSKCNTTSGDVFNKYVGLSRAIKDATPIEYFDEITVPSSMVDIVNHQLGKVKKYFRLEN